MSDHDDDTATKDPRITPLGDNAGVHIRSDHDEVDPVAIDFGGFLVSLATSCLMNLGRYSDPETGEVQTDFDAARQMIQIIEMLQEKTAGNLDTEEEQLLRTLLYDLRIAYVESTQ